MHICWLLFCFEGGFRGIYASGFIWTYIFVTPLRLLQKASTAAVGRQKVQGHERAVFQQLEKLQAQDPARSTKTSTLPVLPAKPQTVSIVEGPGQSSRPVDPTRNAAVAEPQTVKVELADDGALHQGGTDVFWRNNPISQAHQVQLAILLNMVFLYQIYRCPRFEMRLSCVL